MTVRSRHYRKLAPRHATICILFFAVCASALAQAVTAPEAESSSATLEQAGIPRFQDKLLTDSGGNYGPPESPFQWGSLVLKPHFLYRFLYGDGIQSTPGHPLLTAIDTFSPGFLLADANEWTLDYTPTWDLYSNHAFRDTLDQSANFLGKKAYSDWTLQFVQAYAYTSEPLIETGSQTSLQDFTTTVDVTHEFSRKVLLDVNLSQDLQYVVGYVNTFNWSNQDWLHYRLSARLDSAIGIGLGYQDVSAGSDSAYARPEVQGTWHPSDKISLSVTGGLEHREYYGTASPILNTPIYNASVQYAPVDTTSFSFTGGRQVSSSFFENQSSRSTQWTAGIEQRLLKHLHLSASVSYETVAYLASNDALASVRNDEVLSYNARLSTTLLRKATVALIYQKSHDSSTIPGFQYSSNQIGIELSYRY